MTNITNQIANGFRSLFGSTVNYGASIVLNNTGNSIGAIYFQDGIQARSYDSISYATLQDCYFEGNKSGEFSTRYTLTDGGNTMTGTISISVSGGTAISSVTVP